MCTRLACMMSPYSICLLPSDPRQGLPQDWSRWWGERFKPQAGEFARAAVRGYRAASASLVSRFRRLAARSHGCGGTALGGGKFNNYSEGNHMSDSRIKEHMEVIGADGVHIGTVDRVENGKIKL